MLDSFISIRCRLALYSFGVLLIFFCIVFLVNQKVYAEDVPWTSVSNEGERVLSHGCNNNSYPYSRK
ncbi:hypothetical protein CN952_11590 [Bacillus cereus]|nr:hypothetical protein COK16_04665 [Bacillus cereus]PGM72903.1 hypothetical protein CN952_11590 [Bacillus cereus]PGN05239.1 hypothetical protein CN954_25160 [Bacillus cereus]PGR72997.1 hypothetical protein COC63_30080 [Bacillus cereus]